VITLKLSTS